MIAQREEALGAPGIAQDSPWKEDGTGCQGTGKASDETEGLHLNRRAHGTWNQR